MLIGDRAQLVQSRNNQGVTVLQETQCLAERGPAGLRPTSGIAKLMRFIPRSVMVGFVNALAIRCVRMPPPAAPPGVVVWYGRASTVS